MDADLSFDYSELYQLSKKFEMMGGSLEDSAMIKSAIKQATSYLVRQGKSNLRTRVKDQAGWEILHWFTTKVYKKNRGGSAGFSKPKMRHWGPGEHHGLPWWLDKGTGPRWTRSGHYTGIATANYFWEDVRRHDLQTAADMVCDAIRKEIENLTNN